MPDNLFDSMTREIVQTKVDATLTPVGVEPGGPLDGRHAAVFPYDGTDTIKLALLDGFRHVAAAEYQLAHVKEGLTALSALYGVDEEAIEKALGDTYVPAETRDEAVARAEVVRERIRSGELRPAQPTDEQVARAAESEEGAAQVNFELAFAEKAARAQAATFAQPVEQWACPTHGRTTIARKVSRKGREYDACASCLEFEKLPL